MQSAPDSQPHQSHSPAQSPAQTPRVCVVIPCYNEEVTVAGVVRDFRKALPGARIVVFDNASGDRTAEEARAAGAEVIPSGRRGKGNVLRHMSHVIDADLYLIVDGDGTYDASAAPDLIGKLRAAEADMLVATRLDTHADGSFSFFHRFGNHLVSGLVSTLFRTPVTDILSGYRILTRDLVKLVRLRAGGFEVETELTLQALTKRFHIIEVPVPYGRRPEGSHSKLDTFGDGFMILRLLFLLFKDYKPLVFFGAIASVFALGSLLVGSGPVLEFYRTGLVFQLPRAILAAGLGVLATIVLAVGLILDTVSKYHAENIEHWRQQIRDLETLAKKR